METTKKEYGLGRRKTAVAHVRLVGNAAARTVNNRPMADYFPTVDMQVTAISPLTITSTTEQFGLMIRVHGGGKRSQADAVKLAVARALLTVDTKWRKQLKEAGMLRRDPRMKERKKPGLKRARRAPQFSKR